MQGLSPNAVINTDIDRYLSVMKTSEQEYQPLILILRQYEQPKAMIIGRRERHVVPWRIGYKVIFKPRLWCMTVIYGGVLGMPDEEVSSCLVRELMRVLRRREIDLIFFNHLRVDSVFYQQVRQVPHFFCRNPYPVVESHWRMAIPESMDAFFASCSKNQRKHYKRYLKTLESEFSNRIRLCTYTEEKDVSRAISDAAQISQNTYQYALGVGLEDNLSTGALFRMAAKKGWFRGHILYLDGEPAAFRFALKYRRIYFGNGIGYDPKWKKYNIGTFSLLKVIEKLCQDGDVDYYDFGFGNAQWKECQNCESWPEAAMTYIYAPRLYPLTINMMGTLNTRVTLVATRLLRKTGVIGWIKRMWRRKLQRTSMKSKKRT